MRDWWLSVRGPWVDTHAGELGVVMIHNDDFPDGVHLATMVYDVAKEIAAAFPFTASEPQK